MVLWQTPAPPRDRGVAEPEYPLGVLSSSMFTDDQRDVLVRAYEQGASMEALAAEHGCAQSTVRAELLRAGVTPRPRGGRRRSGRRPAAHGTTRVSSVLPSYGYGPT